MVVGLIAPREEIRTNKTDREGEIDKERERDTKLVIESLQS